MSDTTMEFKVSLDLLGLNEKIIEETNLKWGDIVEAAQKASSTHQQRPQYQLANEATEREKLQPGESLFINWGVPGKNKVGYHMLHNLGTAGKEIGIRTPYQTNTIMRSTFEGFTSMRFPRSVAHPENDHSRATIKNRFMNYLNGFKPAPATEQPSDTSNLLPGNAATFSTDPTLENLGQELDIRVQMQGLFDLFAEFGLTLNNANTFDAEKVKNLPYLSFHGISRGSIAIFNTIAFINACRQQIKKKLDASSEKPQALVNLHEYLTIILGRFKQAHYETLVFDARDGLNGTRKGFMAFALLDWILLTPITLLAYPLFAVYKLFTQGTVGKTYGTFHEDVLLQFAHKGLGMLADGYRLDGPTPRKMMKYYPPLVNVITSSNSDWRVAHASSINTAHALAEHYKESGNNTAQPSMVVLSKLTRSSLLFPGQGPGHGTYAFFSRARQTVNARFFAVQRKLKAWGQPIIPFKKEQMDGVKSDDNLPDDMVLHSDQGKVNVPPSRPSGDGSGDGGPPPEIKHPSPAATSRPITPQSNSKPEPAARTMPSPAQTGRDKPTPPA